MKVFKFDVDEKFAREHNEMIRDTRRFRLSGIMLGIIIIAVVIWVYFGPANQAAWALMVLLVGVVMAVIFAVLGLVVGNKNGNAQEAYDRYPLVPGVIAAVDDKGFDLMSLVNTNVDPDIPPRWSLAVRRASTLPGVKEPKRGMQVPCAAVLGQRTSRDKDHWQEVIPMPIAWGTPDQDVVNTARKSIPHEQWSRLDSLRKKLDEVKATPTNLLVL